MINWATVCKPKDEGGLGIRSTFDLNRALLAKQFWRILTEPNSLYSQILTSKYKNKFNDDTFKCPSDATPTWKGIHRAYLLLKPQLCWQIGDGSGISISSKMWFQPIHRKMMSRRLKTSLTMMADGNNNSSLKSIAPKCWKF